MKSAVPYLGFLRWLGVRLDFLANLLVLGMTNPYSGDYYRSKYS